MKINYYFCHQIKLYNNNIYSMKIDDFRRKLSTLPFDKGHDMCASQILDMMKNSRFFLNEDRIQFFNIVFEYIDFYNNGHDNNIGKEDINQHLRILHLCKLILANAPMPSALTDYKILIRKHISTYSKQLRSI